MKHEKNLFWFDFLRGCAAILVLIGHLRALMFQPFTGGAASAVEKIFFFITGFGHEAVVIFFVLSGYFIIRSIHEATENGKWTFSEYAKNRLTRLWVVLLPALIFTLIWDSLGLRLASDSAAYSGLIPNMPGLNPTEQLGVFLFIGNLFFLQNIVVSTYGSNPALWSLANEFWYYVIFPLLYFSLRFYYKPAIRVVLLALAILCFLFIGQGISLYFIIWLMGGVTFLLIKRETPILTSRIIRVILIGLFIAVLALIRVKIYSGIFNDYSLGVVTMLLLSSLAFAAMKNLYLQRVATFLSGISYSVYLMHLSFAVFLTSMVQAQTLAWSYSNLGYYFLLLVIIVCYCVLQYFLFERNTAVVKKLMQGNKTPVAKVL